MLNERKVAQMAAYLLNRRGGRMSHLKLMKLLYLSDRESMRQYDETISGDRLVSMDHGPVLSSTLNYMNGNVESRPGGWEDWISDREDHELSLRKDIASVDELDELSEADIDVLDTIWDKFGKMTRWNVRDYTHQQCEEWRNPEGSSHPIPYERVFLALGRDLRDAKHVGARLEEYDRVDDLFARL